MKTEEITILVRYRVEQADTALADAEYLLAGERSPQGVINRAYYAMFYAVLALLQRIGRVPNKHTGAISLFDTEFVLKGIFPKDLSQDIHKAFRMRQTFDYRSAVSATREDACALLDKARRFVSIVKRHLIAERVITG